MDIESKPGVTIAIPVLNEEDHIERVISGFLKSEYPNIVEILVADGGSVDHTREIVKSISIKDNRVKLVDNPDKFQSYALNKMIEFAKGEIFLRADAHCDYAKDYIEKCVEYLGKNSVRNAGGAARFIATNVLQAGTALSVLSFLGNGGAKHYDPNYEGYADTVPMGCFYTNDLKRIGGFAESNHTNEDAEINYRIRKVTGGKIFVSKNIGLRYYPRKNFKRLFKQYFWYGRGRYLTSTFHKGKIPFRSKAPFLIISSLLLYFLIDQFFFDSRLVSWYILGFILFIVFLESIRVTIKKRDYFKKEIWYGAKEKIPNLFSVSMYVLFSLLTMHFAHFGGYSFQILKAKLFRKKGW